MSATQEQLSELRSINSAVNSIGYTDIASAHEPADVWKDTPDDGTWVCRDYSLAKKERLVQGGWSAALLTVVICWTEPEGDPPFPELHAVLAAEFGDETWILDNRTPDIYRYDQEPYPYKWVKRQVPGTNTFEDIA